jgi:hypothetical protein
MSARVFWFDDEMDSSFCQDLSRRLERDFDLTLVSVSDESDALGGIQQAIETVADLIIIDWKLGLGFDGVWVAHRLLQHWRGAIVFLTRFPKDEPFQVDFDPRISLQDTAKLSGYESDSEFEAWYSSFYAMLLKLLDGTGSHLVSSGEDEGRYLSLTSAEHASLSLDDLQERKSITAELLADELASLFLVASRRIDGGIGWVVLVGWPPVVVRVGRAEDQPPGRELFRKFMSDWGQPPLVVLRPTSVSLASAVRDATSPAEGVECLPYGSLPSGSPDWFPRVDIELGSNRLETHFDTGAELSYWSYEVLRNLNLVESLETDGDWVTQPLRLGLSATSYLPVHLHRFRVSVPGVSGSLSGILPSYIVWRFGETGLSLKCGKLCPLSNEETDQCRYRRGLLGRDLILRNGWQVIISPASRTVRFVADDGTEVDSGAGAARGGPWRRRRPRL